MTAVSEITGCLSFVEGAHLTEVWGACSLKGVEATGIEGDEQYMLRPNIGQGFGHLEHAQGERRTHHYQHASESVGHHQAWQALMLLLGRG